MKLWSAGVAVGLTAITAGNYLARRDGVEANPNGKPAISIDAWNYLYPVSEIRRLGTEQENCKPSDMRVTIGTVRALYDIASTDGQKMDSLLRGGYVLSVRSLCVDRAHIQSTKVGNE